MKRRNAKTPVEVLEVYKHLTTDIWKIVRDTRHIARCCRNQKVKKALIKYADELNMYDRYIESPGHDLYLALEETNAWGEK